MLETILIAPVQSRWQRLFLAETVAGDHVSAACYRRSENIGVLAAIIPELKFGDVKRQVLLADLVIAADDAALEDAPEALNRVGMDSPDDVFASGVLNDLVRAQLLDVPIAGPFAGHEQAHLVGDGVHHEFSENVCTDCADNARHDVALAADRADYGYFVRTKAATTTIPAPAVLVVGLAADEGFINLNDATKLAEILFDKRRTDAMAHIPSGLIRAEADVTMDLPRTHALFAGQQKVNDAIPDPQIDVRVFEKGPGNVGKPIAAGAAIRALPLELHGLEFVGPVRAAARAFDTVRPATGDQIGIAGILIGEGRFELGDGHLRNLLGLLTGHSGSPSRQGR